MKYLIQDNIPYPCCAILSPINARIFLGFPAEIHPEYKDEEPICPPTFGTWLFEKFVDISGCRYAAAICPQKVWYHLRLRGEKGVNRYSWVEARLREERPVVITAWHENRGIHSALVIEAKKRKVELVNWNHGEETSIVNWDSLYFFRRSAIYAFSSLQ